MLSKIEFSDLYKFLTSVGLIIIASAFIIPWLFLKETADVYMTTDLYNNLVENSKTLSNKRICLNLVIVQIIPYLSVFLFGFGFILTFIGIKKWKYKQMIVDQTENINYTRLLASIEDLNPLEVKAKAEKEIEEENYTATWGDKVEVKEHPKPKLEINENENLRNNLIHMEDLFFQKIIKYNSFLYEPSANVKIGDNYAIDILLHSHNHRKNPDILFEIRYLQTNLSMQLIINTYTLLRATFGYYLRTTKRNGELCIIVVYKEKITTDGNEISRFLEACENYKDELTSIDTRQKLIVMNDKEAEDFKIQSIIN